MKYGKCYRPIFYLVDFLGVWIAFCRDRKIGYFLVFLFIQCHLMVEEKISSRLKALLKISHKVNP